MEKVNYENLNEEYKLFLRYATRYNCLSADQLSSAEKKMYSNHITGMFKNMNVAELVYIYSRYVAFQENLNKLAKKYRESLNSFSSKLNNEAYIKFMRDGFHTLTEDEKKLYPRSQYYINDTIARELNFNRGMLEKEVDNIESMVNIMSEELKKAIDEKISLISNDDIKEIEDKKNDLIKETMMLAGQLGRDFDNNSLYNDFNRRVQIYTEFIRQIGVNKNKTNEEQLKTVVSNGGPEREFVSDDEYIENGTHYHTPQFDQETHIQLK